MSSSTRPLTAPAPEPIGCAPGMDAPACGAGGSARQAAPVRLHFRNHAIHHPRLIAARRHQLTQLAPAQSAASTRQCSSSAVAASASALRFLGSASSAVLDQLFRFARELLPCAIATASAQSA